MAAKNKKITQIRIPDTGFNAVNINRALDNIVNHINDTAVQTTNTNNNTAIKKVFIIGNGTDSVYTIKHNFNTKNLLIIPRLISDTYSLSVSASITLIDNNSISIDFGSAIAIDSYVVMIVG